jgi:hypothetical protein
LALPAAAARSTDGNWTCLTVMWRWVAKGATDIVCRNIKTLHNFEPPAMDDEIRASALQFVRKLSGFTHPSKANEAAFEHAVDKVAASARELLHSLVTTAPPRDRAAEAARARARAAMRFGESRESARV